MPSIDGLPIKTALAGSETFSMYDPTEPIETNRTKRSSLDSMNQKTILNAKGSLATHNGTQTVSLLVGADGEVPVANSAIPNGIEWTTQTGENNTASNVGVGGVGVFKQKTGVDLEFKNINAASTKITVADDAGNNEVDIDVDESVLNLGNMTGTAAIANGGTGQTAQTAAFDALDPLTTKGDVIVQDGTNSVRIPVGSNSQILSANSGVAEGIEWISPAFSSRRNLSVVVGNAVSTVRTPYISAAAASNGVANFSFKMPNDFSTIVSAEVYAIASATLASRDIDILVNYSSGIEAYNANSNTNTVATYSFTVDQFFAFDISAVLVGVPAGARVGVGFTHNGIGMTLYYTSLFIDYNRA